ncbi:MAG TPA: hypothetical protein PLE73_05840 [Spirochaetota bacterium]|nr:hypothetical protein [Spirochaetota bacterium]HPI22698.1 hypothetical protein [Spirochaetota bacterium]
MSSNDTCITDRDEIERIIDTIFTNRDLFLRMDDVNQQVEMKEYRDGSVTLRTLERLSTADPCVLFARLDDKLYCARITPTFDPSMAVVVDNRFEYPFSLQMVQVITAARREERTSLASPSAGERPAIIITNLVSDTLLKDCFTAGRDWVEYFKDAIRGKFTDRYSFARVCFLHERFADERMKFFYRERTPLYIENLRETPATEAGKTLYQFYKITIFQKDKGLNTRTTVSEASVPLFYKGVYPLGYLQVNNTSPITQEEFVMIRKVGASASEALSAAKIITAAVDRLVVVDVSAGGLAVAFKDKSLLKYFKDGNYLFFTMLLPEGRSASMLVIVRNISMTRNNITRVGCQIVEIDALGQAHYDEFLETMG